MKLNGENVADLGITFDHNGQVLKVKDKLKFDDELVRADPYVNEQTTNTVKNPHGYQSKTNLRGFLSNN